VCTNLMFVKNCNTLLIIFSVSDTSLVPVDSKFSSATLINNKL
jgi:hypothetical protein